MKLAEALLLRADRNRTLEQIKQRIQVSARYQEGENPPEDARDLVSAASTVLDELEGLIRDINRTNSSTVMGDGRVALILNVPGLVRLSGESRNKRDRVPAA